MLESGYRSFSSSFRIRLAGLTLAILLVVTGCMSQRETFTHADAEELLGAYTEAVRRSDSTQVLTFWSDASSSREGFWTMIARESSLLRFDQFAEFLQDRDFRINEVRTESGYYTVNLDWVPGEQAPDAGGGQRRTHRMRYHIVFEQGRPVLINPIDILTRDWQTYETELFVFHFPKSLNVEDHRFEMEQMDEESQEIADYLGSESGPKVHVYRAVDGRQCGDLMLHPPSHGYAVTAWGLIVTATFTNAHEFVHLLTMPEGSFINAAFSEGIAVALAGGAWYTPEFSLMQARRLIDHNMYIPLREILAMEDQDFLRHGEVTYHEAGAFVRFLLDSYGWDRLAALEKVVKSGKPVAEAFSEVYGQTAAEAEENCVDYLRRLAVPEFSFESPSSAVTVVDMEDPPGDDDGDGSYQYPTDTRFGPGMFDLTRFEVLRDDSLAYFRLSFRSPGGTVMDGARNHGFSRGCTIAIRRDPDAHQTVQRNCLGVTFQPGQGYDLRIDIGRAVQATDVYNRSCLAGPELPHVAAGQSSDILELALPLSFCGQPSADWEFFVGVHLVNDVGTRFLRIIPWHLQADPQPFNIGCGSHPQSKARFIDILDPPEKSQHEILRGVDPSGAVPVSVPMVKATE